MNREETLGKQLLVDEIAQARAYLEGRAPDEQRLAALLKRDASRLRTPSFSGRPSCSGSSARSPSTSGTLSGPRRPQEGLRRPLPS